MAPMIFLLLAFTLGQLVDLYPAKQAKESLDSPLLFLAKIRLRGSTICSGALYRENVVITTATHVQQPRSFYNVSVPIANKTYFGYTTFPVQGVNFHDRFATAINSKYDIAIVHLQRKESAGTGLKLDFAGHGYDVGFPMTMVGWGEIPEDWQETALEIQLPVYDFERCNQINRGKLAGWIELCAGHAKGNRDAHYFLNGSPLLYSLNGHFHLAGVFSWSETYDSQYYPNIFTRISSLENWINLNSNFYKLP